MRGVKTKRIRVALDIDDTVADISSVVMKKVNRRLGTDYTYEHVFGSWDTNKPLWDAYARVYEELWTKKHKAIRLFADKRLLRQLTKHYDVAFISARGWSKVSTQGLADWLKRHRLNHINLEITNESKEKTLLGYDFYIDDYHVKVKGKRMLFLVDHTHNKKIKNSKNVMRVEDVNEALRFLIKRAGNS